VECKDLLLGCAHWSAERLGDAKECEYVIQESLTYDKQVPHGKFSGWEKFQSKWGHTQYREP